MNEDSVCLCSITPLGLREALTSAGNHTEARRLLRSLLALPGELVDDYGIPLARYAAAGLLARREDSTRGSETVRSRAFQNHPTEWFYGTSGWAGF